MTAAKTKQRSAPDRPQLSDAARFWLAAGMTLAITACTSQETGKTPVPLTPPQDRGTAPVVRQERPLPPGTAPGSTELATALVVSVPPEAIYVCVTQSNGKQQQVVIEFDPKVGELCRKHPEMGPCQYERDTCRRSGGRVFAKDGKEVTLATEAEYDKRVMRVRFKAN